MPKATIANGDLTDLTDAYIIVPNPSGGADFKINLNVLPDISDSKSAVYNNEPIIGRSFPLKTYSHSDDRIISVTIHLIAKKNSDLYTNLLIKRTLESCLYPRSDQTQSVPFKPPPVCKIKMGKLLADNELCVIMKSCSVKYPTDVPWDYITYTPWKFDIDTNWEVVYRTSDLPGQEKIISFGG